ncbi:hypothetical protein B0H11DRAFT_1903670 [Mycena galericulata]|nr:hypothetical protein B0H11DRAFT_1903670 [Mycena galericulata]
MHIPHPGVPVHAPCILDCDQRVAGKFKLYLTPPDPETDYLKSKQRTKFKSSIHHILFLFRVPIIDGCWRNTADPPDPQKLVVLVLAEAGSRRRREKYQRSGARDGHHYQIQRLTPSHPAQTESVRCWGVRCGVRGLRKSSGLAARAAKPIALSSGFSRVQIRIRGRFGMPTYDKQAALRGAADPCITALTGEKRPRCVDDSSIQGSVSGGKDPRCEIQHLFFGSAVFSTRDASVGEL